MLRHQRRRLYSILLALLLIFSVICCFPTLLSSASNHRVFESRDKSSRWFDRGNQHGSAVNTIISNNVHNTSFTGVLQARNTRMSPNETDGIDGQPPTSDMNGILDDCSPPPKWLRSRKPCQLKKNILFLKTRRTGSSTVQNLLFRYGEKHGLKFVLPSSGIQFAGVSGIPFQRSQMMKSNNTPESFNILCHYARFSEIGFSSVIPEDAAYITILRDPTTHFESVFTHAQLDKLFRVPGNSFQSSFKNFIERPEKYFNLQSEHLRKWARNPMLYDLGIPPQEMMYLRQIEKYVQYLDKKFDFVILSEYFDESLILLRKFLCLDMHDVAYFEHNVRSAASQFTDTGAEGLDSHVLRWNAGDAKLYQYFREKTLCLINQYGKQNMRREVMRLRELNEKLYGECVDEILNENPNVWSPANSRAVAYKLKDSAKKNAVCVNMVKPEYIFTRDLRSRYTTPSKKGAKQI